MRRVQKWIVAATMVCVVVVASAQSPTTDELGTTVDAMKMRLRDQQNRLEELENKLSDQQRRDAIAEVVKEIDRSGSGVDLPDWLEGLDFSGDLRLRYEGRWRSGRATSSAEKQRNRFRFRLRFGAKKRWMDDQLEVGFRLASGSSSGATSTNQTFDDNFSEKQVWIDRAYAKYQPNFAKGLTVIGGKMSNPLTATKMIWDSDVNPEGFYAGYEYKRLESITPFVGAGYFVIDESSSAHDTVLNVYQAGLHAIPFEQLSWTGALAYYDWDFHDGSAALLNATNTENLQVINVLNKFKTKIADVPVGLTLDYIQNMGDDDARTRFEDENSGYAAYVKVGKNKKAGDVSGKYAYRYIEANATPGNLNDSDFGGSNRKGHSVGLTYNVTKYMTIGGTVIHSQPIVLNSNQDDTLVQVDFKWKF